MVRGKCRLMSLENDGNDVAESAENQCLILHFRYIYEYLIDANCLIFVSKGAEMLPFTTQ